MDSSYAIVRNAIIDEGDEFMKKLFEWERLYVLTIEEQRKYKYILEVVRNCEQILNYWSWGEINE